MYLLRRYYGCGAKYAYDAQGTHGRSDSNITFTMLTGTHLPMMSTVNVETYDVTLFMRTVGPAVSVLSAL